MRIIRPLNGSFGLIARAHVSRVSCRHPLSHSCRAARRSRRSISGCRRGRCQCRSRRGLFGCLSAVQCARRVRFSQLGKTWGSLRWRVSHLCFCSHVKHALLYERMTQFVCCRLQMTGFEAPAAGGDARHTPQTGCSVGTVTGRISYRRGLTVSPLRVARFARGSIVVVGSGRVLASRCAP